MYCFYIYLDPDSNIPFYVGEGTTTRAISHWRKTINGKPTHNRMLTQELSLLLSARKEPIIEITRVNSKTEGLRQEKILVKKYGRRNKDNNGILCNRCSVGSDNTGTGHFSRARPADVRAKISAGHLGKPKPKHSIQHNLQISQSLKGRKFTTEHKTNLSIATRGVKHKYAPRVCFEILDPNGKIIHVNGNLGNFCLEKGLNGKSLYNTLKKQLPIRIGKNAGWQLLRVIKLPPSCLPTTS